MKPSATFVMLNLFQHPSSRAPLGRDSIAARRSVAQWTLKQVQGDDFQPEGTR